MNYKRNKSKTQIRCRLCTKHRDGNTKNSSVLDRKTLRLLDKGAKDFIERFIPLMKKMFKE